MFDLSGRRALVTGGSKGLGKVMGRGLAQAGADVIIVSRHADELDAALIEILEGTGVHGGSVAADLTLSTDIDRVARDAETLIGPIDILVNNAAASTPEPVDEITDEAWDAVVGLNLRAAMALTRALAPGMKQRRWGRVIHVTSVLGFMSRGGRSVYSATKAGLTGLARGSAIDLGPFGITVNCLAPGPFRTALTERSIDAEETAKAFVDRTALLRWGDPDEIIGPLLLLASDAGAYVTGTTLVVDGGWLAK